jgi:iron complex outermembrane receptor protein
MFRSSDRFLRFAAVSLIAAAAFAQETAAPSDSAVTQDLEKVTVRANRKPEKSEYVAKMPLKRVENPTVYNTVESRVLKEQVITNFDAAMKNVPGVSKLWEPTGRGGDGGTYFSMRGFETQPSVINGIPGLTFGGLDPANIERIEVLKGPSGTLFGSSVVSYGGLINVVTKQPSPIAHTEATYTTGSFGLNRVVADVNRPLDAEGKAAARVITAYHTENSFQDAGFRKSLFVAPSLSYQATDRLSFLITTEFLSSEFTNPTMLFLNRSKPLDWNNLDELGYDPKRSLTSNDLSVRNPKFNAQAQMNYKLSDSWNSQTVVARGVSESHGYYSYLWNEAPGSFSLYITDMNASTLTTNIQQNFQGDFEIAGFRNRVVVGFDYFQRQALDYGAGWGQVGEFLPDGTEIPIISGTDTLPSYLMTRASVDDLLASVGYSSRSNTKQDVYSVYASDVFNVLPQLSLMLSLRADWFTTEGEVTVKGDDYDQVALSPKVGVVYQPILDKLSLFANYQNGFKNVEPGTVSDTDGSNSRTKTFRPEQANQVEGGVKTNLFNGRVSSTASVYYIKVKDRVMGDPTNPNNSVQGGEIESKGFEIDANVDILPGLNVLAGYSYNESEVLAFVGDDVFLPVGRRPVDAGPKHLANVWITYRLLDGALRGLGIGAGSNISGEMSIMDSPTVGTFTLPGYQLFNASVFYDRGPVSVVLAVDNLTDVEYYTGYSTINPQKPRNVAASVGYRF